MRNKLLRVLAAFLILTMYGSGRSTASRQTGMSLPDHFARCTPAAKLVCEDGKCETTAPKTFYLLGDGCEGKRYSRCDSVACDTYEAVAKQAGLYENWQLTEPRGTILKRSLSGDREFVEVATLGMQVYISFGECEENSH